MTRRTLILLAVLVSASAVPGAEPTAEQTAFFESHVRPILAEACFKCHGPRKQESGLRLDARAALLKGGENGPAIVPGKAADSLLVKAVQHTGDLKMPPSKTLKDDQIMTLVHWIDMGAPWPAESKTVQLRNGDITDEDRKFWSFAPVRNPPLPEVRDTAWVKTPVDRFILATLEAKGLTPVKSADRRTLLRRITFDLTGLPPRSEEIDEFERGASLNQQVAIEKAVERLLASPAYGERWGRHWLDVVRYADTAGETADYPVPQAYLYRNYVIDAFNKDKPYDQFIREQVAGDILAKTAPPEKYAELVTATGFIAISRRFGFDPQNYHHLTIQDTIDTLGQSVLGLSLGCARCHHHKFDPVNMADYYSLYGIFAGTNYSFPGSEERQRPSNFVPLVPSVEEAALKKAHDEQVSKLAAEIKELAGQKVAAEKELKAGGAKPEVKARLDALAAQLAEKEKQRSALAEKGAYAVAYGAFEGKPQNARIHKRGEPRTPGDEVPRRNLTILGGEPVPTTAGSGRLELARWLTDSRNPLTARVMVNRIWQHHFGNGLVATENDFGARGQRPTHPELLDYLAHQFMASGWSVKALHRLIVLSRTYQLGGDNDARNAALDADNRLLWRHDRRRLDAEAIRDAMLLLSGNLDRTVGGPHPFPPVERWGFTQHNPFTAVYDTNRRSVYLMTQRLKRHPFLALFDGPDTNASTAKRIPTIVPTQALFLMNDPFVHEQSTGLARRVLALRAEDAGQIKEAYRLTLGREARAEDVTRGLRFLEKYRQQLQAAGVAAEQRALMSCAALGRTLLTCNEFLFLD
jgi:cytochrome c553